MISIYENETDLLMSKVVRFERWKPIGRLRDSQNLRKMAPVAAR